MGKSERPELKPRPHSLAKDAKDWLRQFSKHLDINYQDHCAKLGPKSTPADFQSAAMLAVFQTLIDSGQSRETILESFAEAAVLFQHPSGEWNEDLNARRFELIEKDSEARLTVAERIELGGLTVMMRKHLDPDLNVSIEAAQKLLNNLRKKHSPKKR